MTKRTNITDENLDQMLKLALAKAFDEIIADEPSVTPIDTPNRGRRQPTRQRWAKAN